MNYSVDRRVRWLSSPRGCSGRTADARSACRPCEGELARCADQKIRGGSGDPARGIRRARRAEMRREARLRPPAKGIGPRPLSAEPWCTAGAGAVGSCCTLPCLGLEETELPESFRLRGRVVTLVMSLGCSL